MLVDKSECNLLLNKQSSKCTKKESTYWQKKCYQNKENGTTIDANMHIKNQAIQKSALTIELGGFNYMDLRYPFRSSITPNILSTLFSPPKQ